MGIETVALLGLGALSAVGTVAASRGASPQPATSSNVDYSVLNTIPEPKMPARDPAIAQTSGPTVVTGADTPVQDDQQIRFVDPAKVKRKSVQTIGNLGRGGLSI